MRRNVGAVRRSVAADVVAALSCRARAQGSDRDQRGLDHHIHEFPQLMRQVAAKGNHARFGCESISGCIRNGCDTRGSPSQTCVRVPP